MENDMEAIKRRLLDAEAKIGVQEDFLMALRTVLSQTLQLLHERGTLPLPDVVARLRALSAFSVAAHDQQPPRMLAALTESLQSVADAYAERGK